MRLTKEQVARQQAALRMLRGISKRLPGAEEYVMVHHPAFRVGKKPFAIAGMDEGDAGATVSINLGPEAQGHLLGDDRFRRTPYIGQHGWVTVLYHALSEAELSALVIDSYRRIAGKKQLALFDAGAATSAAAPRRASKNVSQPRAGATPRPAKARKAAQTARTKPTKPAKKRG